MKKGPFAEHSNALWGISGVAEWSKVNSGLIKMYKAEVYILYKITALCSGCVHITECRGDCGYVASSGQLCGFCGQYHIWGSQCCVRHDISNIP